MTGNYNHITDGELLDSFYSSRDNKWLGILLERYTLLLLGVSMKYLKNEDAARDSVQQIFLKVLQELHKYRVQYFKSWLYMVAKNHCLMKLREQQGRHTSDIPDELLSEPAAETQLETLEQNELALDLVEASLDELNDEQRQCITLFYLQKKSYQEVSETTGYTLLQVKSHIQNGKRNLRIMVEKKLKAQQRN